MVMIGDIHLKSAYSCASQVNEGLARPDTYINVVDSGNAASISARSSSLSLKSSAPMKPSRLGGIAGADDSAKRYQEKQS